jgi:hypothetical protein
MVQALLSAQSAAVLQQPAIGIWIQPRVGSQESFVQALPVLQFSGVPDAHCPCWHVSIPSQTLALPQATPSCTGVLMQPVVGLQESSVHWLLSLQSVGPPLTQVPLLQESLFVQALPSLHEPPLGFAGFEHTPFAGLQVPTSWH